MGPGSVYLISWVIGWKLERARRRCEPCAYQRTPKRLSLKDYESLAASLKAIQTVGSRPLVTQEAPDRRTALRHETMG